MHGLSVALHSDQLPQRSDADHTCIASAAICTSTDMQVGLHVGRQQQLKLAGTLIEKLHDNMLELK